MKTVEELKVRIFADGADRAGMLEMYRKPFIKGFTTNPTLMRKAGVSNYEVFAKDIIRAIPDRSISFEVFADDFAEMERQARRIASWGKHVSVKIPITNTKGESAIPLVDKLSHDGIALNVTAMFTLEQVQDVVDAAKGGAGGGGATLTPLGQRMLSAYRDLEAAALKAGARELAVMHRALAEH